MGRTELTLPPDFFRKRHQEMESPSANYRVTIEINEFGLGEDPIVARRSRVFWAGSEDVAETVMKEALAAAEGQEIKILEEYYRKIPSQKGAAL